MISVVPALRTLNSSKQLARAEPRKVALKLGEEFINLLRDVHACNMGPFFTHITA